MAVRTLFLSALYCAEHYKRKNLTTGLKLVLQRQMSFCTDTNNNNFLPINNLSDYPVIASFSVLKTMLCHALNNSETDKV